MCCLAAKYGSITVFKALIPVY